jgi:hypothetical protein
MAVRAKAGASHITHQPGPPKTTSIGQGKRSRPRRKGKKALRGQGR